MLDRLIPMMMLCHRHDRDPEMRPSRSVRRSAKKSPCTWRLGCWGRIGISGRIGRSVPVPTGANHGARLPRSSGTTCVRTAPGRSTRSAAAGRR